MSQYVIIICMYLKISYPAADYLDI